MSNKESIRIPACGHMWTREEEDDNVGRMFSWTENSVFQVSLNRCHCKTPATDVHVVSCTTNLKNKCL